MKEVVILPETEPSLVSPSHKKIKMEDRKRPLNDLSDDNQPSKRQATVASSTSEQIPQGQEDVVHFQKEAIYRQMQVYKREKDMAESRLEELVKRSTYHDDHLRVIDAWWDQLLDEVRILTDAKMPIQETLKNGDSNHGLPESLFFADDETFNQHLLNKHNSIVSNLSSLFQNVRVGRKDEGVTQLERQMAQLLADRKSHDMELNRVRSEKEDLEQQLTDAALRYLQAEKKLDRLKSVTLAKIEKQATQQPTANTTKKEIKSEPESESTSKAADGQIEDLDLARKEAQAIASKQEKELQQLQADNARLSEHVTKYTIKLGRLSEEDIATCDAYKNLKIRMDDLVTRYNHIEALNNNLKQETEKLAAERAAYKDILEREQDIALNDMNAQIAKNDSDLARIRAVRDEAVQEATMRKTAADKHLSTLNESNELASARKYRIDSLDAEVTRLRLQLSQEKAVPDADLSSLNHEELLDRYTQLNTAYKILEEEIPQLETAFKKTHDLASNKIINLQDSSAKMERLVQEKVKAEQKYFTTMKAKDAIQHEARLLKAQHSKSSEIISQLKDAEKSMSSMVSNLEKQLAELKNIQQLASTQAKDYQRRIGENSNTIESLKHQVGHLSEALKSKDHGVTAEADARRKAEIELEKVLVKLESAERKLKANAKPESEDEHLEALRSMVRCSICRHRLKNTVINGCGHVFCKECAEERITSRSRKCPNCGRPFAKTDMITIHL